MIPIFSIWIKTKKTFEYLANHDKAINNKIINLLFFLIPMSAGFSSANDINLLLESNYFIGLTISMVLSGLIGLFIFKYVFTFILWLTGKIFQGKATKDEIQMVLAYSFIPNLLHLLIGLILIISAIVLGNMGIISYQHPVTIFVISIYTLRIMTLGLAYFNKYSYKYALLTIFIPIIIIQGIIFGLKYLIV